VPAGAPAALVLPIVEIRSGSAVPDAQKHGVA
jgi:cholesterol oxidase